MKLLAMGGYADFADGRSVLTRTPILGRVLKSPASSLFGPLPMKLNYMKKPVAPRKWRKRSAVSGGIIGGIAGSNRDLQEALGVSTSLFTPGILLGAGVGWVLGIVFDDKESAADDKKGKA